RPNCWIHQQVISCDHPDRCAGKLHSNESRHWRLGTARCVFAGTVVPGSREGFLFLPPASLVGRTVPVAGRSTIPPVEIKEPDARRSVMVRFSRPLWCDLGPAPARAIQPIGEKLRSWSGTNLAWPALGWHCPNRRAERREPGTACGVDAALWISVILV